MTKLDLISRTEKIVFHSGFVLTLFFSIAIAILIEDSFLGNWPWFFKWPTFFIISCIIWIICLGILALIPEHISPLARKLTGIEDTSKKVEGENIDREMKEEEQFRELSLDYKMYRLWQGQHFNERYYFDFFKKEFKAVGIMLSIIILMLALILARLFKIF